MAMSGHPHANAARIHTTPLRRSELSYTKSLVREHSVSVCPTYPEKLLLQPDLAQATPG